MSGLTNGTAYTFTVKATNSAGSSAASAASAAVTPAPAGTTLTDHFDSGSDSPAWTATTDGSWTRNVMGLDGNSDASVAYAAAGGTTTTTLQLMDLHGDVAATATPTGTGLSATYTYDEFGNPTNTNALRYSWLGGKDRAQTGVGNLTLMGQRLYNPATGRFLQTDPVPGGSANRYDYCNGDPVNCYDLQGTWPHWVKKAAHWVNKHRKIITICAVAALAVTGVGLALDAGLAVGAAGAATAEGLETAAAVTETVGVSADATAEFAAPEELSSVLYETQEDAANSIQSYSTLANGTAHTPIATDHFTNAVLTTAFFLARAFGL